MTTLPGECCATCVSLNSQCTLKGSPLISSDMSDASRTITTFDGLTYKFNGKCNYVLTRDCDDDDRTFMIHLVQDPIDSSVPPVSSAGKVSTDTVSPVSLSPSSWSSSFVSSSSHKVNFTAPTPRDNLNTHSSHTIHKMPHARGESLTHLSPPSLSSSLSLVPFNSSTLTVQMPLMVARTPSYTRSVHRSVRQTTGTSSSSVGDHVSSTSVRRASISLVVKIGATKVRLTPTSGPEGWKIRHGRTQTSLPFIQPGVMTIVKKAIPSSRATGGRSNILIFTTKGIEVTWNGDDHLSILVPRQLKNTLCGLCGNYNDNKRDDLRPRKGRRSRSISRFIKSWKVGKNGFCPKTSKRHVNGRKIKFSRLPLIDT